MYRAVPEGNQEVGLKGLAGLRATRRLGAKAETLWRPWAKSEPQVVVFKAGKVSRCRLLECRTRGW